MRIANFSWLAAAALIGTVGCGGSDGGRGRTGTDGGGGDTDGGGGDSDGGGGDIDGGGGDTDGGGGDGCGMLAECGGSCVDTRYDPAHCGACDAPCATTERCNDGTCASACGVGTMDCSGVCRDVAIDPANCGSCGNPCNVAAGEVCRDGGCGIVCPGGTENCGGSCVDTQSSRSHCGGCMMPCPMGEACFDGVCSTRPAVDADADTIADIDEQSSIPRDTDGDMTPDYMDADSDGDGLSDAAEAGDTSVSTPPVDSDGDRTPDFQDTDSDNDGLDDAEETTLGTDPTDSDTDGDGETDGVETAGGSDPTDPLDTLGGRGDFTFDLPPGGMARTDTLTFMPRVAKADVLFLVDTTGSMGGVINGLQSSLDSLVTMIRTEIPDTAFGVARHDDFPTGPPTGGAYGSASCAGESDYPYQLEQRITTNMADVTAGTAALDMPLHCGADGPESQIESLYQAATGAGFRSPAGAAWTTPFMGMTGFDATRGHGLIGGAGFRMDSLPIIILATDITFHRKWSDVTVTADRASWCGDLMGDTCDAYAMGSFGAAADQQPKTVAETLTALNAIGAKVFGLAVDGVTTPSTTTSDQRAELSTFAVRTGAYIDPVGGMCSTNVSGGMRPAEMWDADGAGPLASRSLCPLVFSTTSAGSGVSSGIVSAIRDLTRFISFTTVHTEARDDAATVGIDESRFFVRGIPVSADPATCMPAPTVVDRLMGSPPVPGVDGTFDSFTAVRPGCIVTFQIVARNDGFVAATCRDQLFNLRVIVVGNDVVEADSRTVIVRVPGDASLCP
jgi:hypothetical protein